MAHKFLVGDEVVVIAGSDCGKVGQILSINREKNLVVVEGINESTRHIKPRGNREGGKKEFFAPIHLSNVSLVDPKSKKPTRVRIEIKQDGEKIRIAKKSGEIVTKMDQKKPKTAEKESDKTVIKA